MGTLALWLSNLILPDEPETLIINGPMGTWTLTRTPSYVTVRAAVIEGRGCANTYSVEAVAEQEQLEALLSELRFLCIVLSYLSGRTVGPHGHLPHSDLSFLTVGDGFPRIRAMLGLPLVGTASEFVDAATTMLGGMAAQSSANHADVMCHHLLNVLSAWCLEDAYLSACTVMELIKWTERRATGDSTLSLYEAVARAATRQSLAPPPRDFTKMRNDLIHDGRLAATNFSGKTKDECADLAADVLSWIDEFVKKLMGLPPLQRRFDSVLLRSLPSFTIW